MIAADLVRAAVLLPVVVLWAVLDRPPGGGLVLAVVVLAAGQALFRPALQAILPELVAAPQLLPATNALLDTTERIARPLGPGLVAVLAGMLPMMHFLSLDAATFIVSALSVMLIGRLRHFAPVRPPPDARIFASVYGLIVSSYGLTNLLATLVVGNCGLPLRPARLVCGGNMIFGIGTLLMVSSHCYHCTRGSPP